METTIEKKSLSKDLRNLGLTLLFLLAGCLNVEIVSGQMTFVHPGAVNSKADLDFVKAKITAGEQPWTGKFNDVKALATTYTKTTSPQDGSENDQRADGRLAYANALAWYYTGNATYAQNAIAVLNVWGKTFNGYALPPVGQGNQSLLNAGWIGALLGPAAEIMRGYSGWAIADMTMVQTMFKTKFYPALNQMSTWNGNVDLTQIDAMMNIAVFCEDETEFNLGIQRLKSRNPLYFYLTTEGNPPNSANWFNPTQWVDGLTQETCRDNNHHAQYAMASAFHAAEVAWNQGVDVYGENALRYTATLELMANQIMTGKMGTCTNDVTAPDLYATWEVGYNHYHNRMKMNLPNTGLLITSRVRANSQSDWNIFYETLTHNQDGSQGYNACPKPDLGVDLTICGQNSLALHSNVTSTGKTIKWYKDNAIIDGQTGISLTATSTGSYKVVVDSANCSMSDELVISGTLVVDLGGDKELCNPSSYTLDAGNAAVPNISYQWNTGETSKSILADKAGSYSVTVNAPNCSSATASISITSKLLTVNSDTICSQGTISMSVTGTGTYNWYDVPTNGVTLATGNSYSPGITSSSTYYVEEAGGFEGSLGRTDKGTGGTVWTVTGVDFAGTDKMNKVTVLQALTLKSIAVYVSAANTSVTINFMQGTTTAHTKTFSNLAIGKQTLALNFDLAAGNYVINTIGSAGALDFESTNSGAAFPYSLSGYMSFTFNETWQSAWYGLFYDWKISTGSPCVRTPVYAVIDNSKSTCTLTSISENSTTPVFSVYPNPAKETLIVNSKRLIAGEQNEIQITNSLGALVYNSKLRSDSELSLDVSHLKSGLYFIRIGNQTQKIVIQK